MSTALYHFALVTHFIGITLMAGTSFIDFMGFRILYKAYPADRVKVLVFNDYLYRLQRFMGFGMLIILASGVAMMIKLHALWGAQLWFRIKMGFLLLIIINGLLLRRNAGNALNHILSKNDPMNNTGRQRGWAHTKRNLIAIQGIQLLLFITIYILSVFKFN